MKKKKLPRSIRKYIRSRKAKIRRLAKDEKELEKSLQDLYSRFFGSKEKK